ncbi:MAG TPA: radical SAM protein [Candidatus Omnitrophota bacterium]|nr:radical SAM protein [Candidatus Omnitrophota bacterium]HPS36989.1 radical SAM protein [Candidatus Omnitrophota bacterium]
MLKLILRRESKLKLALSMLRWHAAYYLSGRGFPVSAGVYITDACNSRCLMCDIWKNREKHVYPREAQERAIDDLAKLGCYYYSLSGGEPTLVEDLPARLAYAAKKIPYVHLVTNGFSMNTSLAQALGASGVKEISISIDGTEDFHNTLRGIPQAFQKAWNALELLRAHAPRVLLVVNSLVTPYNLDSLRALSKRLEIFKENVYQKLLPYSAHDLFGKKDPACFSVFGEGAALPEIERFLDEAAKNPKIVNSRVFLNKAKSYFGGERNILPEQKYCLYPCHSIEFDCHGSAYPCFTGMNFKCGIPAGTDLVKTLRSPAYQASQKKLRDCTRCHGQMPLCYYEPRLNFPVTHLLRSAMTARKRTPRSAAADKAPERP